MRCVTERCADDVLWIESSMLKDNAWTLVNGRALLLLATLLKKRTCVVRVLFSTRRKHSSNQTLSPSAWWSLAVEKKNIRNGQDEVTRQASQTG